MGEEKIRSITAIYYSKPEVQQALFDFSKSREVVPRYFEGFGKRPDMLQYPGDIMGLVNKGATSFHASEELWQDPLKISTDMNQEQLSQLRSGWDLLVDIDSPYLDYSKIAAALLVDQFEKYKIKSYSIKFSGSKGFHLIVPSAAFPAYFEGKDTRLMFPEWPRAIVEFLLYSIKSEYNRRISEMGVNFEAIEKRMNIKKDELLESSCPNCGSPAKKGIETRLQCPRCRTIVERKDMKMTKRKLKCIDPGCPGFLDVINEKEYLYCEKCGTSSFGKGDDVSRKVVYSVRQGSADFKSEFVGEKLGSLDLVLVSSRHLFRMPYSLHEKTALASAVITKEQLASFTPKDADPLKVKVQNYYKIPVLGEAENLLAVALRWKSLHQEEAPKKTYQNIEEVEIKGVTEEMFPAPIKKLLKGLKDGRKRGLFVLITFLRSLNFPEDYINQRVREWNTKNDPPLKEGYVKSQVEWHLKQGRKILPPNYSNQSFYKDLNLIDKEPDAKNPIVEVIRKIRKARE